VYTAADSELGRKVAIKFLSPQMAASNRAVERLIREAKAASALNHPHIITVYEVIRAKNDVAIAMELVEGRPLRKFCGKPAEIAQVIHWGCQIAQALAAAHQRNIVHRDVKPENLMVRDDGILKVLDFGLASQSDAEYQRRSTDSSGIGGTLNYMSPEQVRSERATSASDVFSLGLVLYELATGTHPFRSASPVDTAHAIVHTEPKSPSSLNRGIPANLETLLLKMLSKDPGKRPPALEVDQQLSLVGLRKPGRRSGVIAWVAAAMSVVAISGALIYGLRDKLFPARELQFLQLTRQVNENRVTTAAISPDGKTLLFATFGGPVYRRRMNDGLSQPVDTLKGLHIDRMVWFNDGSKILIDGSMAGALDKYEPGIWVMPAKGGRLEQVASGAKDGVPSPDGSRIAFTSTNGSLLSIVSMTSGERRQIRSGGETTSFTSLVWSPDGKRIAFQRVEYVPPATVDSDPRSFLALHRYRYSYESVDVDSGQLAASAKDFIMESACGLRDGRILFLRNTIEQSFIHHLWSLRTDPNTGKFLEQPRLFTHEDYELKEISASADGQEVVAVRGVNGHPNIYVADLPPARQYPRFTRVRRLTFTEADEYPHAWTPDSRSVIFESYRNGNFDLFRQEIDQSDARPLVISNDLKALAHVSPDGKWILYNERHLKERWKVMRIPLEGGAAETILPDAGLVGEYNCAPHPAGRCVLRTVQDGQFRFWDLDPARGKGRELARTGWSPAIVADWDISPDGSRVAIPNHDPRDARIRLVPLDARAGTAEKTVTIKTLKNLSGVVWAADGRGWYVAVRGTHRGLLLYVDLEGRILTNLMESMEPNFAVPSPDGRHVAFMDWTVSANVWQVRGL
jgi:Tol biopolymer transport system component